ncbi:MAG: sugar ABC transporter permease [Lachnospiraceae bacterium]|nr:sugar ABC transporter permease [Lachnospiraceae bacterium]
MFMIYPILYTFGIGFTNMTDKLQMQIAQEEMIGIETTKVELLDNVFENYEFVLSDPNFWGSLKNTVIIWGVNFVPQILLALLLAVWFTNGRNKIRGKGFFKVLFYMPNIITAATIAMLFTKLFDYNKGPVNDLLKMLGVIDKNIDFFTIEWTSKAIVAFVQFWMWYGYTMIILISGILGISPELFEAADIDGASGWQKFRYVTLPNLKTIMLFTLVTSMIGGMTMFDIPYMIGGSGGIRGNIRTASVYIFEMSFQGGKLYNRASAASMIMFVMIAVLAAVIFFLLRDKDEIAQHKIEKANEKAFKKALKEQKAKGGVQ